MKHFLSFIWSKHRRSTIALALALVVFSFFVSGFVFDAIYFANPVNKDRALELWMSPHYVDFSWGLTRPVTFEIMEIDMSLPPKDRPHTVADVLQRTGMTLEQLQQRVESAQRALQESKQP